MYSNKVTVRTYIVVYSSSETSVITDRLFGAVTEKTTVRAKNLSKGIDFRLMELATVIGGFK
jgi:hypothetical protein